MKLKTFRIVKKEFAHKNMLGEGAKLYGGRWNSIGMAMIYTSANLSLANLEILTAAKISRFKHNFVYVTFEFNSNQVYEFPQNELPSGWDEWPYNVGTQKIGDLWLSEKTSLVLKVPSSLVKIEHNYLINQKHPAFKNVKISSPISFEINERFIGE